MTWLAIVLYVAQDEQALFWSIMGGSIVLAAGVYSIVAGVWRLLRSRAP